MCAETVVPEASRGARQSPACAPRPGPIQLSVVVPVYRNAATLRELHQRVKIACARRVDGLEFVFVDDACPDGSGSVLAELEAADPFVRVVTREANGGQQRAIVAGLKESRGDAVVVMDADLQDPPEAIPSLLAAMSGGVAAVFAGRRGRYESATRLTTSKIFKSLLHLLCGVSADAGAFVLMDRRMVERVLSLHAPSPFLVAMIGCSGLPVETIPVEREVRSHGESAYTGALRLRIALSALAWTLYWRVTARRARGGTRASRG